MTTPDTPLRRRPTVVEVAAHAGVSIASVSRVLNGKLVRPDTTDRVRSAVAELGYRPDATGRSLKLGARQQIALAVDDIGNPVYTEMMRGVQDGLATSGAQLLLSSAGHDPDDLLALVQSLSRGYADGLIISPLRRSPALVQALVGAPVPVVLIGDLGADTPLDRVRVDSASAVRMAHRHLRETGRRRIAFVNGPDDTAPGQARRKGFRRAAIESGDPEGPVIVADGFTVADGERAWPTVAALRGRQRPDAVIAANDLLALGIMRAALTSRRRVPASLAVVGIDDTEFARIVSPSLTSVSLRARERGRIAAGLLLDRMAAPAAPPRTVSVTPSLVIRESSWPR